MATNIPMKCESFIPKPDSQSTEVNCNNCKYYGRYDMLAMIKDPETGRTHCERTYSDYMCFKKRVGIFMDNTDSRKDVHSVYFSDGVWDSMQTFARFFSLATGIKNNRGQSMGAGTFVDIACKAYIQQNNEVLRIANDFFDKLELDDIKNTTQKFRKDVLSYEKDEQ